MCYVPATNYCLTKEILFCHNAEMNNNAILFFIYNYCLFSAVLDGS